MLIFLAVCLLAVAVGYAIAKMAGGILSEGANSDADKQIHAAAYIGEWAWPSDMHRHAGGKAWMKDVGVLLLAVAQRILRDRKGFYPLVALCNAVNSFCAVLVFVVAENYWSTEVGLLMFSMFVMCFWPYQIVLQGGYQGLALACLLLSVYFLQQAEVALLSYAPYWYLVSGVMFGLMLFSSASGRKFIPMYWAAVVFSARGFSEPFWIFRPGGERIWTWAALAAAGLIGAMVIGFILVRVTYKSVTKSIYFGHAPRSLIRLFKNKDQNRVEHYLELARGYITKLRNLVCSLSTFLFLCLLFFRSGSFYVSMGSACLGCFGICFLFLYPDILHNILGFMSYWTISVWGDHFPLYDDYFRKRFRRVFRSGTGGWTWTRRFFWRMVPFHTLFLLAAFVWLIYLSGFQQYGARELAGTLFVLLVGVSPVVWSEITKGPKASLPYFPSFVGLLLVIAYGAFKAQEELPGVAAVWFWLAAFAAIAISSAWNIWIFISDTWPCKMGTAWLAATLSKLEAGKFYTYDTRYNDVWVNALPAEMRQQYNIEYIKTLRDVTEGYIVIPPTTSKSSNFQSSTVGHGGDFEADPLLNELINTRAIGRYAVSSFKTFGSSQYWQQIGDVASYRDLVLQEVGEEDRWRGRAWIIDAWKLRADLAPGGVGDQRGKLADVDSPQRLLFESTP